MAKLQNTRKHHTQGSQEVSPFKADDHKDARNRQENITTTNMNLNNKKGSTKEARTCMRGSRNFCQGGGGGVQVSLTKKLLQRFFFVFFSPQLILQKSNGQF